MNKNVTGVFPLYTVVGYPKNWILTIGKSVYYLTNKRVGTGKPTRIFVDSVEVTTDSEDVLMSYPDDLYPDEESIVRRITMETLKLSL